jgi:hypothetical protein
MPSKVSWVRHLLGSELLCLIHSLLDDNGARKSFPSSSMRKMCCVEVECHFCYLRDPSVYVHESCCLGVQRHLPTYMKRRKLQDGPVTYMQQIWYLISVTKCDAG